MRWPFPPTLPRAFGLAVAAGAAALIANALGPPHRRLAWFGSVAPMTALAPTAGRPEAPQAAVQPPPSLASPALTLPPPSRPARTSSGSASPPAAEPVAAPNPIQEISSAEAWAAFQQGSPFLDARRSAEFAEGHVAMAWCVPVWEADVDDRLLAFKAARQPGPEDPIVIYCSGGDCRDSHLLATKLLSEGYFHLLIYRDGFPDWAAQGHPVERGQP